MNRALAISKSSPPSGSTSATRAATAWANGASRCGAGICSSTISGRARTVASASRAARNSAGGSSSLASLPRFPAFARLVGSTTRRVGRRIAHRSRRAATVRPGDPRSVLPDGGPASSRRLGGSAVVSAASDPTRPSDSDSVTSDFVRAARGLPVSRTPVWFMRQAGRSLPEYRALRAGTGMLAACQDPDLVTEITLQPVRRHGVDAAILFSDIVLPLVVAGVDIDIKPGVGPVVAQPVRSVADVDALPPLEPERLDFLQTAVRQLVAELGATPLIGFAGAPFTLATYLIEGGPSKEHARTKAFMYAEPEAWGRLLDRLAVSAATFLITQVDAGASAVQLFDSWAGVLSAADYAERVLPHSRAVFEAIGSRDVPRIHFGVGTGELLPLIGQAGGGG